MDAVIFLDFDGVLLPAGEGRRQGLDAFSYAELVRFDPVCVSRAVDLAHEFDAKFVISSTHAVRGKAVVVGLLRRNGVLTDLVHPDWCVPTPLGVTTKAARVRIWVESHRQVGRWVAFDDEAGISELAPRGILVRPEIGLSQQDVDRARAILRKVSARMEDLPPELIEDIQQSGMDPRHDRLNALLEQPPEKPKP